MHDKDSNNNLEIKFWNNWLGFTNYDQQFVMHSTACYILKQSKNMFFILYKENNRRSVVCLNNIKLILHKKKTAKRSFPRIHVVIAGFKSRFIEQCLN